MAQSSAAFNLIFGAKTDQLEKALSTVDGKLRRTAAKFNRLGKSMSVGITAPLAAIGGQSFRTFATFEQSMAKVLAVSGATGKEFQALEANARELGATTRFTASDVAGLQLEFAKLGFTAGELTQVTEATLALAQASGSDLAQSAEVAGATLRGFGLEASETGRVTDVMAQAFSTSALDLASFQDSMKFVAPVAAAAGVSLEEATAMLGQLANAGVKGSQAGTALRRIISEVAGSGQDLGEAMTKTADEVLNLADAKDAVGRTAQSAFIILKNGLGTVDGLTKGLENSQGAAKRMAEVMDNTAQGAVARMSSAVEGAQISIGAALAPAVIAMTENVAALAARFDRLSDGTKRTVVVTASLAAALGPLLIALGAVIRSIRTMRIAMLSLNKTIRANPIGALVTVVTIAIGFLYDYGTAAHAAEDADRNFGDQISRTNTNLEQRNQLIKDSLNVGSEDARSVKDLQDQIAGLKTELDGLSSVNLERLENQLLAIEVGETVDAGDIALAPEIADQVYEELSSPEIQDAVGEAIAAADTADQIEAAMLEGTNQAISNVAQNIRDRISVLEDALTTAQGRVAGAGGDGGDDDDKKKKKSTREITFEVKGKDGDSARILAGLAEETFKISQVQIFTGDTQQGARDLADATERAAKALAEVGELELASTLKDEAKQILTDAGIKLPPVTFEITPQVGDPEDTLTPIFDALGAATNQASAAFAVTGDQLANAQALADAYEQAAIAAVATGQDSVLADQLIAEAEAARQLANELEKAKEKEEDLADSANQLAQTTQAFAGAIESTVAAAIRGEEDLGQTIKAAGKQILAALLAETIGTAIRNAFQSASATGPAAVAVGPALAGAAVAGVTALFNGIPALKDGGITLGPTLALIGDNPGGREAVIPLDRLRSMMDDRSGAGGALTVSGRLSGRDLILSGERSQRLTDRTYGPRTF